MMTHTKHDHHALVLGGGIAGLLSARVLADHFEQVTLIERDYVPPGPEIRAGVPQARHVHFLLMRGKAIIEQFFPGIVAELEAAGAVRLDWTQDLKAYSSPGWFCRFPSKYAMLGCSRALLEWTIRQRLTAWTNVHSRATTEAVGLLADAQRVRVTGARVRQRKPDTHEVGPEEDLLADLVVDTSGRDSRAPEWLKAFGYEQPQETIINGFAGYASRFYQCPSGWQADWRILTVVNAYPIVKRGGVIFPIEENRWLVTLVGINRDYPPTDEVGFSEFVKSLPVPEIYEALQQAKPVSAITGYQRMENRWRHYERLSRLPDGLVVLGDAVCALNPIFGQGMTVAAQSAWVLGRLLTQQPKGDLTGLGQRAQKAFAKVSATPWLFASGEDLRLPEAEGDRPGRLASVTYWYSDRLREVLTYDQKAMSTFVEVTHLLKSPTALFQPRLVLEVLRQVRKRRSS